MNTINLNDHDLKTYATEANLTKGLERLGLADHPCERMIVRTPNGRWTAIFLTSNYTRKHGGYAAFAARHGFLSI